MDAEAGQRSMRIGLTGGIASGKTTVANMFADLGVVVVDTDLIAREIVEPEKPALDEIRQAFGDRVIDQSGELDRRALRSIVFADDEKRRRLEAILHPRIRDEAARQSELASSPYHLVVVPLLAESPMKADMDRILVVDCDEDVQLKRLLERDAESPEQARRIIASQASRHERLAIADDVVRNDRSIDETKRRVRELHEKYLSLSGDSHRN